MIFLELEDAIVELTGTKLSVKGLKNGCIMPLEKAPVRAVILLSVGGHDVVFTGTEPECRAVLGRIIEKLDHVNREVVIRRSDYLPEATP